MILNWLKLETATVELYVTLSGEMRVAFLRRMNLPLTGGQAKVIRTITTSKLAWYFIVILRGFQNSDSKWIKKHQTPTIESRTSTNADRMGKGSHHSSFLILHLRDPRTQWWDDRLFRTFCLLHLHVSGSDPILLRSPLPTYKRNPLLVGQSVFCSHITELRSTDVGTGGEIISNSTDHPKKKRKKNTHT